MTRNHTTPGAVRNVIARMNALGNGSIPCAADDLVNAPGDAARVERVRVVVPGQSFTMGRYGGAATVRGSNLPNAVAVVRIRAL